MPHDDTTEKWGKVSLSIYKGREFSPKLFETMVRRVVQLFFIIPINPIQLTSII